MPDAAGGLSRVPGLLAALGRLAGPGLRVWRDLGRGVAGSPALLAGEAPPGGWAPPLDGAAANGGQGTEGGVRLDAPFGSVWLAPVPGAPGVWLETAGAAPHAAGEVVGEIVAALLAAERETAQVAGELLGRYEEIDLIYSISEILGQTVRLEEAAQRILVEVSNVVRAGRATLLVADEERQVLRLTAARGMDPSEVEPIEMDDPCSVAARVFREQRTISYDPTAPGGGSPGCPEGRNYRGQAFLSVPVTYAAPGAAPRPIGVINLTDRHGEDAFTAGDRKLVAAIASQIGAAVENARLVGRERAQQRTHRELELAHDLQLKLLPSPLVIAARCDVAARCRSADSVGGDLYNFLALRDGRIGVMIGDVSSHGFGAALIMALVVAASGIHAETVDAPSEVLRRLEQSLADELSRTEMFLTLFYAAVDPAARQLVYANAGHAHAFLVSGATGAAERLAATRPPLGLSQAAGPDARRPWQPKRDVLCLFTDGIAEAVNGRGERFGEERVLGHVARLRGRSVREALEAIFADLAAFTEGAAAKDDRTLVLLRA
jgi:sigma-B regulation protein RsbU (phosphoserine phosphatase)